MCLFSTSFSVEDIIIHTRKWSDVSISFKNSDFIVNSYKLICKNVINCYSHFYLLLQAYSWLASTHSPRHKACRLACFIKSFIVTKMDIFKNTLHSNLLLGIEPGIVCTVDTGGCGVGACGTCCAVACLGMGETFHF